MGRSILRFSIASRRSDFNQSVKHAWNTWGLSNVRTMRKTSLRGTPKGKGRPWHRNSCLARAHLAMAVGPLAPARIAMMAMTIDRTARVLQRVEVLGDIGERGVLRVGHGISPVQKRKKVARRNG